MSIAQRIGFIIVIALAVSTGGGCLCWLTGDCVQKLAPPSDPVPANGTVDVPVSITLSWSASTEINGHSVRHDLYLSSNNPPVLYRPSVTGGTVTLDSLAQARTYYWRVVLIDENGRQILGPLWTFTTVYPPAFLAVTFPTWATSWSPGESRTIQWRAAYVGSEVRIELFKSGTNLCTIAESTPNDGLFPWQMTSCVSESDPDYRVKVTSLFDESFYDYSDLFTVVTSCPIELSSPHEREVLIAGQQHPILWRPLGIGTNVKVSLHLYKGSDFQYIVAPVTPDDGEFSWIVSDFNGGSGADYRIRVTDLNGLGCSKFSGFFTIQACSVSVTSPAANDIWPLESQHTIAWDTTGLPDIMELELYHQGEFVCVLDSQVLNSGAYLWTVTRCASPFGAEFQIRLHSGIGGPCGFSGRFSFH